MAKPPLCKERDGEHTCTLYRDHISVEHVDQHSQHRWVSPQPVDNPVDNCPKPGSFRS